MLFCTGSPKTGTHLLLKAVHLFGEECDEAVHSHKDHNVRWSAEDKRVHIIRNPRDVVISWVRYQHLPRNDRTIIKSMSFMIKCMLGHVGWLNEPHCLTVRFEELLKDQKVLESIGSYLNLPLAEDHFESLWGGTSTFTGDLTNWKEFWNDKIDSEWKSRGGVELENKLGYVN